MSTDNILLLTNLLVQYLGKAAEWAALIAKARGEGRDVSDAELQTLLGLDDAAAADLQALIDAKS